MKAKFSIFRIFERGYYFIFKNAGGKKIFTSEPYPGIMECKHGISVMKILASSGKYQEEMVIKNNLYSFILKNTEGVLIGRSENYLSSLSRNDTLQQLKCDIPLALVIDHT
jgi:uncharacterized protein YegP (UPF0339 family)